MTNKSIFEKWKKVCKQKEQQLLENWDSRKDYTNAVLYNDDAVVFDLAEELKLSVTGEYYALDAIFYKEKDIVKSESKNKTWVSTTGNWLTHFYIAFEHENAIEGTQGGYQEICHLLTTKSDFKVLVGYIGGHSSEEYAEDFQSIIKQSGKSDSILLILGDITESGKIHWDGYELTKNAYIKL